MMLTALITQLKISKKRFQILKIKAVIQKRDLKNCKSLNTILESVDTIVNFGATLTSLTLSTTGIGLKLLPI